MDIEAGPQRSEFAVVVDGSPVFSRLEQRRYPEVEEVVAILHEI
ncbi:Rdx family protein [Trichloromonas sp.]